MTMLEIKLSAIEKKYNIFVKDDDYKKGQKVLVDNGQIIDIAEIVDIKKDWKKTKNENIKSQDKEIKFVRIATADDLQKIDLLKKRALSYIDLCKQKTKKYSLNDMKIIGADLSFDEKKLTFYFSAEGRVDFRELVADLAKTYKKIIRLQQIGSRDEAKRLGGIGKCGRELCCSSFLDEIDSVTLDMAKEQEIGLSSNKLAGVCGKLMCCLSYELENYKLLAKKLPVIGELVKLKKEKGKVVLRNILKQTYTVETPDGKRIEVKK